MKFMDHLKDRIKYKTKTVVRVENGVTEHIKLKAKRLPRLLRKLRKLGKLLLLKHCLTYSSQRNLMCR